MTFTDLSFYMLQITRNSSPKNLNSVIYSPSSYNILQNIYICIFLSKLCRFSYVNVANLKM